MFNDDTKITEMAGRFIERLRAVGLYGVSPCSAVQPPIMDAVIGAIRDGEFCLTMLGRLSDGLRTCVLEYLGSEPGQGYNVDGISPRAWAVVQNISDSPYNYTARAQEVLLPQRGRVLAVSSVTGRPHRSVYRRTHAAIEPGGVATLSASKAHSRLANACRLYHSELEYAQPKAPHVVDRLREVGGGISVWEPDAELGLREVRIEWPPALVIKPGKKAAE